MNDVSDESLLPANHHFLSQAMMEAESIHRARQVVGLSAEPSANEAPQARRAM
jgi:hypothetical protein